MEVTTRSADERVPWTALPYYMMHVAALGVFFVPFSWSCVALCVGMYYLRMFGITAGYHRYFAHRGYKTGRIFQFVLAWLGTMACQKGVLWWSGHHRHHHKFSDQPEDIHSPKKGFWWSHQSWFLAPKYETTPASQLREFGAYPELLFLNRFWVTGPVFLGVGMFLIGGWSWLFWGFVLSTVVLWHGTFTINSLAHVWGSTRYETGDTSRNNFLLALITMGEGWHNNHHYYQSTANNGFFWWEIDCSYYILKALSWIGVVRDLRTPPDWVLEGKRPNPVREEAQPLLPIGVRQAMASVLELRAQVASRTKSAGLVASPHASAEAGHDETVTDCRANLAEAALEAAERAAAAAKDASESAAQFADELRTRLAAGAAEAAEAAAAAAAEAAEAAQEMAELLKTRVAEAWADAAERAAEAAALAAESAKAAANAAPA